MREHIGNLMRTHWELEETCWEQRKNEKTAPPAAPPPTQNLKDKKLAA